MPSLNYRCLYIVCPLSDARALRLDTTFKVLLFNNNTLMYYNYYILPHITFDHWYHTSFVWNFHSKNRRGIDGHAEIDVTASRAPICRLKKWWNVIAQTKACLVNIWWLFAYIVFPKTITFPSFYLHENIKRYLYEKIFSHQNTFGILIISSQGIFSDQEIK